MYFDELPSNQTGGEDKWAARVAMFTRARLLSLGHEARIIVYPGGISALHKMVLASNASLSDYVISIHANASCGYALGSMVLCRSGDQAWATRWMRLLAARLKIPERGIQVRDELCLFAHGKKPRLLCEINAYDRPAGATFNEQHALIGIAIADTFLASIGQPVEDDMTPAEYQELKTMVARSMTRALAAEVQATGAVMIAKGQKEEALAFIKNGMAQVKDERKRLGLE